MSKRKTHEQFMKEFYEKNPNAKNIEILEKYTARSKKILCECKIDGHKWSPVAKTLLGSKNMKPCGCPKCGYSKKDLTQKFIEEAKLIHGDSYDYSEVVWNGFKEKLKIICPEHGAFYMTRNHHIVRQQGCPICAISKRGHKLTNQEFIDRAKNIYGDFYSYEKTNYQD